MKQKFIHFSCILWKMLILIVYLCIFFGLGRLYDGAHAVKVMPAKTALKAIQKAPKFLSNLKNIKKIPSLSRNHEKILKNILKIRDQSNQMPGTRLNSLLTSSKKWKSYWIMQTSPRPRSLWAGGMTISSSVNLTPLVINVVLHANKECRITDGVTDNLILHSITVPVVSGRR